MKIVVDIANFAAVAVVASMAFMLCVCGIFWFARATGRSLRSIFFRASRGRKVVLLVISLVATIHGGSKNLTQRSSSDSGVDIVSVIASNTNGVTTISAVSTGDHAKPMWYRNSTTNEWTAATDDGFEHVYSSYLPETQVFSNVWTRAETNFTPNAAYWFGNDPPAVEIISEGGLYMEAWRANGRDVAVAWRIDDGVVVTPGSRIVLEYGFGPGFLWVEIASGELSPASERSGEFVAHGFFVGFATRWRLKLEVPR